MFAIISLAWATVMRDRRFLAAGVWFLVLMIMFNFGSSSVISYRPLPLFERYVYPILLPAVVLVSGTLAALLESRAEWGLMKERRFWAVTFGVAYFLICAQGVSHLRARPEQDVRDVARPILFIQTSERRRAWYFFERVNYFHIQIQ